MGPLFRRSVFSRFFLFLAVFALVAALAAVGQAPSAFPGVTNVAAVSAPISVTVPVTVGGLSVLPVAVSQGTASGEFSVLNGVGCVGVLTAGSSCTVTVVFSPRFPGVRTGAVVVSTAGGSVLGTAMLVGTAKGALAVLSPGRIDTVVGDGDWIYRGDGVVATQAPIFLPTGVAEDAAGNIYLSDSNNNRVRRVDVVTGMISTVAGTGSPGFSGDGGLAVNATVSAPSGLLVDGAGNVYFVDSGNQCVRRIDAATQVITTVAGVGGVEGGIGDSGPATAANLALPEAIAMDAAGNLYIADTGNHSIRKVDAVTKVITTVAGTGTAGYNGDSKLATQAMLHSPWGVTIGPDGLLYIADLDNERVRRVDASGVISTVAGSGVKGFNGDGAAATQGALNAPAAVTLDPAGNIYIADAGNNRIRKVTQGTGFLSTIAGSDSEQFLGDGGPANMATFYGPYALLFDQGGNLLIADMFHNRIRRISATAISLQYATIRVSKTSAPQAEGLENDGNADMHTLPFAFLNAALDPATTTCAIGTMVAGSVCNLGVEFAPLVVGDLIQGSVTVLSDAGNAPNVITVSGQVLTVNPTSVVVTSSENPSLVGDAVTFTASVSSSDTTIAGTMDFLDGTTVLCHAVTVTAKAASCKVSTLTLGTHSVTASYTGDSDNASSASPVLSQVVKQAATLVLSATPNPAVVTKVVSMSVVATAPTGVPSGTVTFYDGTTALMSATLDVHGLASVTTIALTPGTHALTVKYAGDTANAAGQSAAVSEVVSQGGTVTMLSSDNASVTVGAAVTLTATVASTDGLTPAGTVSFSDGATSLGTATLGVAGAAITVSTLAPGTHSIVATYVGDTNDATSKSAPMVQIVNQIATTTVVVSDTNPASAGAAVQFSATVAMVAGATADGALAGQVTFRDGATVLGTATMNAQGVAALVTKTLSVATHAITASYVGSTNYAVSTSAALSEVIHSTTSTTGLSAGSGGALAGKTVTLTAVVGSTTGIPTGSVKFLDGATELGQVSVNAQGTAVFTTTTLSVGAHSLTAVYGGDANYDGSTSAVLPQLITLGTPTVTLVGPSGAVNAGTAANFSVTFATDGVAPAGVLKLMDGATVVSAQTLSAAGTFTFSSSTLAIGSHVMTAVYGGDADNATAVSANVTVVVQQAATATTLVSSANPQTLGQSVTLTAAVTSVSPGLSGQVNFLDGATVLGSGALNALGVAMFATSSLTAGAHTLTAVYVGDTNHAGSSAAALTQHVVQSSQIGLSSSANPAVAGASVVLSVKMALSGALAPTGTVNLLDGAQLIGTATLDGTGAASFATTTLSVGAHNLTASYAGDASFSAVTSAVLVQTVTNANTQVLLTASANPATYGAAETFTVQVTSNGGVATGAVTLLDGATVIGTATLNGAGAATVTLSTLAPGAHSLLANYAGDGKASASVSAALVVVVKQAAAVALATSVNPASTLSAVTLTAHVTNAGQSVASGTVTFTDGSVQLGVVTLDGSGTATMTLPSMTSGSHAIVASYAGDAVDFAAVSQTLTQTVALRTTTTTLTATTDPTNNQQVTLIGVVRWTGPVVPTGAMTFTNGATVLGSVPVDATGVATLVIVVGTASESIVAAYGGDTAYAGSASSATTIGSTPSTQFSMVIDPGKVSVAKDQHTTVNLTLGSLKNFGDTMSFGCLGLPYAATCTFSKTQMELKSGGAATVQLTIDTGNPLGAGAAATSSVRARETGVMLCFLPGMALLGLLWRKRVKFAAALVLVVAFGLMFATTGCGGLQVNGTPAGTYTFQVTALGQNTGVSQSQTMTLTVTQ